MDHINIGFIGLGNMGAGMCLNIIKNGYKVTVHDINKDSAVSALEMGAVWANSPKELAQKSDVIFTSLPGPKEVEAVSVGEQSILDGIDEGSIWVDLSTSSPNLIQALHETFASKGAKVMDAPVSGGVTGAESGRLAIMVGGDEETFNNLKSVLESFGDRVTYTGPIGTGTICKLMNNAFQYGMEVLLSESLTLGVKAGVNTQKLVECLRNGGGGRGNILNVTFPQTYLKGNFDPPRFKLTGAQKDVSLALELARQHDVPMASATHTYNEMTSAINRGWGDLDSRVSLLLQEERAGNIEVRITDEDDVS